jgi:hypothetical protein
MPASTEVKRRELLGGVAVVLGVTGFVLGKRVVRALATPPSREDCEALLERWLEHASRQRDPLVDDTDVAVARERARTRPEFLADLERCEEQLTKGEVECGIEAPNADALERCVQ